VHAYVIICMMTIWNTYLGYIMKKTTQFIFT